MPVAYAPPTARPFTSTTAPPARWRRLATHPMLWMIGVWVAANWWWLGVHRGARVFELDEAAYAAMAARLSRQRSPASMWQVLAEEGVHGPLQAIVAAPPQWLLGSDPGTLLWQNVLFGAGTAVAIYAMTKRLASHGAGLVAAAVGLLSFGVIEYSRVAMTVMPATFFAALAMVALVHGRGLERAWWAAGTGAAIGCMTLSRSMTLGFVPAIAVAALGWAVSRRTPLPTVVRNGTLVAATGLAVALWWWVLRWAAVSDYLFGGGSADTVQRGDPVLEKVRLHGLDLGQRVGTAAVVTALVAYLILRVLGRSAERAARSPAPDLALWPLAASVVTGLAILSLGTVFGVGFTMPLLSWAVTAVVAAVWRTLPGRLWWIWTAAVLVAATVPLATARGSGLASPIWCAFESPRSNCDVDTVAESEAWRDATHEIGDRIWRARGAARDEWDFAVALLSRDLLLNGNTLRLDAEVRRQTSLDLFRFFPPGLSHDEQLLDVIDEADLLVVAEDYRPDEILLGAYQPDPEKALDTARAAGFTPCGDVTLPDGRSVTFLAAADAPPASCAP